jgi:hypothetical protein
MTPLAAATFPDGRPYNESDKVITEAQHKNMSAFL